MGMWKSQVPPNPRRAGARGEAMNIVLLAIDTLRPDHLGCYGYGKNTSPSIDALAAESVVFEQAIAAGIPTMPSFTTMLTGLHPYRHGIVAHIGEKQRVAASVQTLPQLAQKAGWTTLGIDNLVIQGGGKGSWFARGFDHYSGFLYAPFTNQSEQLIDRAIQFIGEQDKQTPFFLYCHLWDPHTPYGPPAPFNTMHYTPGSADYSMDEVYAHAPEYYKAFLGEMKPSNPDDYAALFQTGRLAAISGQRLDHGLTVLRQCLTMTTPEGQPSHAAAHWRIGFILEKRATNREPAPPTKRP